jgi:signal transduction histidine kinase/CheY-like chemotaxis protein/HPt (histidine-containing phosphotransfer) domain-containing protein
VYRLTSSIGLRGRIILIGIAILVPLIAVMLQLAQYERDSALASAEQKVKLFASLTADRQYRFVQNAQIVLSQLANDWHTLPTAEGCSEFLAAVEARHEWMSALRVSGSDGGGVCADRPEVLAFNMSDRGYFRAVLSGEAFAISDQLSSREAGQSIVVAAVPVRDGDRLIGVLAAAIDLEALADLLPFELRHDPGVIVDLIDGNGMLLARHPHVPELIGKLGSDEPLFKMALQLPRGTVELPDLKGKARLFAFQKIDTVDWVVAVGISRDAVLGPIETALHERLLLIAAIVASSCLIGLLGGEVFVLRPLRDLARTAQALQRGDLAARPRLTGVSEVGALERALNGMAEAIEQRDSDLNASRAAREQAVGDARQANEATSQFLASMSHEIRTQIGGIVGYNDLLLAENLGPKQRRYAERTGAAAAAVITVIDGILDIARIEAREVEIEHLPFLLSALIDNVISMIRPTAEHKGLDLSFDLDSELPPAVLGDESRLRQVLLNLLTNAVKFTATGGVTLRVQHAQSDGCIRFSVLDSGIGIAEDQHHRLFKRFSQVHDASRHDYGGTGLGLAICKHLVELMGGRLGFTSEPGQGSTFWIELALPLANALEIKQHSAPAHSPKSGRILVADDYEMNREITCAMLTMAGHEVDVVGDGAQAVEAVRHTAYDLVLMDIEMRGMNGMTAIGQIRQLDGPARHVPVIAMTANVLPQQVRAFKEAGMNGHLGRPFTRSQLIDMVNRFLSPARVGASGAGKPSPARVCAHDKKALTEMKNLIGEQRTAAWVGTLRSQLEAIVAIDGKPISRPKLAGTAHTLVAQAGSLGFTRLSRLSSELEEACIQRADYADALCNVKKASHAALSIIDRIQNRGHSTAHLARADRK